MGFSFKRFSPVSIVKKAVALPVSVAKALPAPPIVKKVVAAPVSIAKALPSPLAVVKKVVTAPMAVNVKVMGKAMSNATKTLPPALAKLSNNVSAAVIIADKSIVSGKMPTRAENLQAARGVATVAAVVGSVVVGAGGLAAGAVKGAGSLVKVVSTAAKAKQVLDARKAQKLSQSEAASVDAELARVNEQIAAEQRAEKSGAAAPADEQKKNSEAFAFAGAGLLALKALAFL